MDNQNHEKASHEIAKDFLISPEAVEIAFIQHIYALLDMRKMKKIGDYEFANNLSVCAGCMARGIEISKTLGHTVH